ncbi:MAG: carboxypeptidase, partial [Chloroflexi bacterium]|nr:carboxypeptidase [Chloroflexota bacterium]
CDEELGGKGYIDWYPFDHPDLGPVELGGWDWLYAFKNPPPHLLEKEIAPFAQWLTWHLLISGRLEVYHAEVRPLGAETYRVILMLQNSGWLPTYATKKALESKLVRGVVCEIALPAGASLETGKERELVGELEGRAYKPVAPPFYGPADATTDRVKVEWVVRAPQGGEATLTARHPRAGTVRVTVSLGR